MPGRRRKIPNIYNLHLPMEVAAHSDAAHTLLVTIIKHLAYAREQCHAPYQQLETHAQACRRQHQQQLEQFGRAKRLKSSSRKAIKYYDRLSGLLQLANTIPFHQLSNMSVAVILGSSVQRPREVYCLQLPAAMHDPGQVAPPPSKAVGAATRKLLRRLIMDHDTVQEWDSTPGPTKMFLLFEAADGALQSAPQGFTVKRAFHINLKKAFQVNLLLGRETTANTAPAQEQQQQLHQQQQAQQHQQQHHYHHHQPSSQQPPVVPPSAAAVAVAGEGDDVAMEHLSQQLSTHMSLVDQGSAQACTVWYQASIHVKGLKPLTTS